MMRVTIRWWKTTKYQGPRPQTRIAALVMMADAVEAASRVLTDPTPARISSLVERIINHIFLDGLEEVGKPQIIIDRIVE
jgi:membrane-associated HD superfamily phosphohydrolase